MQELIIDILIHFDAYMLLHIRSTENITIRFALKDLFSITEMIGFMLNIIIR